MLQRGDGYDDPSRRRPRLAWREQAGCRGPSASISRVHIAGQGESSLLEELGRDPGLVDGERSIGEWLRHRGVIANGRRLELLAGGAAGLDLGNCDERIGGVVPL